MREVNNLTKEKMEREKRKLKRQKELNNIWLMRNRFLAYRIKELAHLKVKKYFSPRTTSMVLAANFSEFLGHVDECLLEQPLVMLEFQDNAFKTELVKLTGKHQINKV